MGQGEVGGCTRRVQTAWPRLGSSLEATWLALGGPFLSFLHYGVETSNLILYGLHFQNSRPIFQLRQVGISQDLSRCLLIDGCGQSHMSVKDG